MDSEGFSHGHAEHHHRRHRQLRGGQPQVGLATGTDLRRLTLANGRVTHCELGLGDSIVNLGEAMEGFPAHGLLAQIFVEDADALFERAVKAGASVVMPMTDMFFGVREGRVSDPYGNTWTIATLKERVSPEEMQRRMAAEGY